jgi:mono/diheme cytochrome c family protein
MAADDVDFFESKVEPLLREKCLPCHSHAARQMEGGLTLDSQSGWQSGGDRGSAVVPGEPDQSLIISAVRHDDPDLQMPPGGQLTDAEIEILVEWVRRGAPDPRRVEPPETAASDWWSLRKLVAPEVPGRGHPIDAFVRERLADRGLRPAERADRVTLARRLYVDLHGFLPTPEEVDAFVTDNDPGAYENLVDDLLSSPRYGERWARHWLDVIHFADSHGCEHDVKRPYAWRFRDYVIHRLNADVPWGRFIREQLAADVYFADEPRLTAALGFIAAGPLELSRATTAPVTFDYLDRDDMVTQTMAAFVSATANCARCHTHKFDPITQEDYYALQAVFAGVGKGNVEYDASAETMKLREELKGLLTAAAARDAKVLLQPQYAEIVSGWAEAQRSNSVNWRILQPAVFVASSGATLTKQPDASLVATGEVTDQEVYTVTSPADLNRLTAVRLEVLADERLPKGGPGRATNGNLHLSEVDIRWFPVGADVSTKLKISRATADFDQDGWTSAQAIDGDPTTGWAIFPRVNESHHIVFEFAEPVDVKRGGTLAVTLKQQHPPEHAIGRFRLAVTDAEGGEARALPREVINGLKKAAEQRTSSESVAIAAVALESYANRRLADLPPKLVVYGVSPSWSRAKKLSAPQPPKEVHLLRRGDIEKPVREVVPGALSAIEALPGRFELADPDRESLRRAALADWLAHPDNPLTWRSIVNRVWHYHFGRGLCDTPNDFGRMGSEPTHPKLLDWLAVWFRDEAKGSLKQLHRLILTSETWQQSSDVAANGIDADNRLLWRMNRQRMDAEVFRDSVLRMSGQLDLSMGGPGVEQFQKFKGPQKTPTLDYAAYDWESPGAKRRSIYRVVWRGIPDPFMEAMDFPDLGLLAPKRGFSVSALQSLTMFNNDFVLHGSDWLAGRVEREQAGVKAQVDGAVELAWLRTPAEDERQRFVAYTVEHGLPAFCRVLLNSNEFLFVD